MFMINIGSGNSLLPDGTKPLPESNVVSLYPPLQRSWKGGILVSPCPSVRLWTESLRSVSSTILIGSISYLHILSSTFRRCVACNARFKNLKFWRIFKLCNFDFVFFWLGIQYDSMVWVIMRRGYPQNAGVLVHWPALRAGLLCCNFFGQPGSVSKFPPFVWVKLWVGWVGRGYTEISRYFPASWINWVTLVTKIKLLYSLRF